MSGFYAMPATPVRPLSAWPFVATCLAPPLLAAACTLAAAALAAPAAERGAGGSTEADPRAPLCRRIDAVLAHARDARLLDARVNGAWQVVHGILAFGPELPLSTADGRTPALPWLLDGGTLAGWRLRPADHGVLATIEEGSTTGQGHPDQWMGYLSQCGRDGLPSDTPITVAGRRFTLADLLSQAQSDIRPGREATWTLMALSRWLPPDASWTAGDGRRWTVEEVARMEAEAAVAGAACGGAHRLYALATALAAERRALEAKGRTGVRLSAGWAAVEARVDEHVELARSLQQPDGSFSVHFFERPGSSRDLFQRLGATGHVFEFLVVALDDERLAEPWVTRAAERLVTLLEQSEDVDVECGALYHAAHGLLLYRERICGGGVGG